MDNATCSEPECEKPPLCRGMCVTHYHRWNRATKAERPEVGTCEACGATLRALKKFCGPECRPRCTVNGCEKPIHGEDLCSAHLSRLRRLGDPLAPLVRQPVKGRTCEVPGCGQPMRKHPHCAGHYAMLLRYGHVKPFAYKWSDEPNCLVCGAPNGEYRSRKFCSAKCSRYWHNNGKTVPPNPRCVRCGVEIDLAAGTKQRSRIRGDIKMCRRCKVHHRTELTPGQLALRDGSFCQLCGCDVDLLATHPDPMRPSVDHIVPRALGGSDAAENNQLTHLLCNQIKSDRTTGLPWEVMP